MTAADYIASLEEPRRSEVQHLHHLIRRTAPDLDIVMLPNLIGYGPFRYRHATGREGDTARICVSSRKNYIAVYSWRWIRLRTGFRRRSAGWLVLRLRG